MRRRNQADDPEAGVKAILAKVTGKAPAANAPEPVLPASSAQEAGKTPSIQAAPIRGETDDLLREIAGHLNRLVQLQTETLHLLRHATGIARMDNESMAQIDRVRRQEGWVK
jgi:hypothetical protein